jgi:hypothetical protein
VIKYRLCVDQQTTSTGCNKSLAKIFFILETQKHIEKITVPGSRSPHFAGWAFNVLQIQTKETLQARTAGWPR